MEQVTRVQCACTNSVLKQIAFYPTLPGFVDPRHQPHINKILPWPGLKICVLLHWRLVFYCEAILAFYKALHKSV